MQAVVAEAAVDELFKPQKLEAGKPVHTEFTSFDLPIEILDLLQGANPHIYLFYVATLFWLCLKFISFYQVVLCVSLITMAFYLYVNYMAFVFPDDEIKWIRRESSLLRAILEDAAAITSLIDQLKTKYEHPKLNSKFDSSAEIVGLPRLDAGAEIVDSGAEEEIVNFSAEEEIVDSGAEEEIADSGAEIVDSGAEEEIADSGAEIVGLSRLDAGAEIVDSGAEEEIVNFSAEEEIVDSSAEIVGLSRLDAGAEIVDSGAEEEIVDSSAEVIVDSSAEIVGLTNSELLRWVGETNRVVREAEELLKAFESRPREKLSYMEIQELFLRTRLVKNMINDCIAIKKALKIPVCESVAKSWSVIRKLLDRPIEQHGNKWVNSILGVDASELLTSSLLKKVDTTIKKLDHVKKFGIVEGETVELQTVELQLMLLHPFLQLIQGLHLESEIERAWLKEVDEIVDEAKVAIDGFSKSTNYEYRWLPVPNILRDWKARRKLKADINYIAVGFTDLFKRKERYGFKFIIRDSPKSNYQSYPITGCENYVSNVVRDIRDYLNGKGRVQPDWVFKELEKLCNKLENMCILLDNLRSIAGINKLREDWFKQMENIAKSASESKSSFSKNIPRGSNYLSWSIKRDRDQLSRDIDRITHHIDLLERSITAYQIESDESSSVVGLEENVEAIVSQLTKDITGHQDCSRPDVVSIVGMEGIGKTTLAKEIYSHRAVVGSFGFRAWVNVPENYGEEISFLEYVAEQVQVNDPTLKESSRNSEQYLWQMVRGSLCKKKYILVLDNVSTVGAWVILKRMLPPKSDGSKIILTTRKDFASAADSFALHRLRLRTKDESLSLLKQMVNNSQANPEVIVSRCLGLPLSIVSVGYMILMQNATASEVLDLPMLKSSFKKTDHNDLPLNLNQLLQHCELFPEDFEIPARRLITVCVSEGLEKENGEENETLEQVAEKRLFELVDRGIVQILERKATGKIKTCRLPFTTEPQPLKFLHDSQQFGGTVIKDDTRLVRRLAYSFNKNRESFCLIHSKSSSQDELAECIKLHRYDPRVDEPREDICCFHQKFIEDQAVCWMSLDYRELTSVLTFDPREGNEPGETIGNFLRKGIERGHFQQLEVLDLERAFRPDLPNSIGKLKKLKYLGLRWTYLQSVPSSIGDLVHLETLDVKHTYVHTLPSSVWKLQSLRKLYLNQSNRFKFQRQPRDSFLKNIETFWGVFIDKDSPLKNFLNELTKLRKLGLTFHLDDQDQRRSLAKQISNLKNLQTLRLRSIDDKGKPRKLHLKLSCLENLSSIELFGKLKKPLVEAKLPKKLTELTLSASGLSDDPMPKLAKLPNLKLLWLRSNTYTGVRMVCSEKGFPKLLFLKIWKLEELEELIIQEKALQNLRELEIRGCKKLKVPDGLKNLKMLLELKLTNMPEEFASKIENDKRVIWGNSTHSPSINVINY